VEPDVDLTLDMGTPVSTTQHRSGPGWSGLHCVSSSSSSKRGDELPVHAAHERCVVASQRVNGQVASTISSRWTRGS